MKNLGDFEMELVPTSNASMALSRRMEENAWTACTYDVARGVVDLCLGGFWVTKERIERGISMASAFATEEMYIIASKKAAAPGFWRVITQPFRPFSADVMLGLFLVWASVGLVYTLYDVYDIKTAAKDDDRRGTMAELTKVLEGPPKSPLKKLKVITRHYGHRLHCAVMEFLSSTVAYEGMDHEERSVGLKMVKTGYALFTVVVIACFTGNMAAIRSQSDGVGEVENLAQCDASPSCRRVCVSGIADSIFKEQYPNLDFVSSLGWGYDVVRDYFDGKCDIAIYWPKTFDFSTVHFPPDQYDISAEAMCDPKTGHIMGRTLEASIGLSFPVRNELHSAFSGLTVQIQQGKMVDNKHAEYMNTFGSMCGSDGNSYSQQGPDEESMQFSFDDLRAVFYIPVMFLVLGVLIDAVDHHYHFSDYEKMRAKARRGVRKTLDGVRRFSVTTRVTPDESR
ncbi:hypothetical protein TrCOL_g13485 [Triparma columacea]|uniref:Ionotropic glutamate receptor C-terminal domain-containing protein n=1 Tax=Triparma columacea TaxID=722753 RepID=A0A9W7FY36_9STRA|nr:hypothetical protein TrCOL_g13485 [Triparma columacea]